MLSSASASVLSCTNVQIVCVAPPGRPGDGSVVVLADGGISEPIPYAVLHPSIFEITPSSGAASGGIPITIRGQNFGRAADNRNWDFGGATAVELAWHNDGEVVVESPPGDGTVDVTLSFAPPPTTAAGGFTYTSSLGAGDAPAPGAFALRQNRPNPFAGRTTIGMDFAEGTPFRLAVYDINGRLVSELRDVAAAGTRTVTWDGTDTTGTPVASGVYFYRLEAGDFVSVKRMIVSR